jgi:hypothetical protein
MNTIIFTKVDEDNLHTIEDWVSSIHKHICWCPSKRCVNIITSTELTQPEMDTITANANAEFIKVTFE